MEQTCTFQSVNHLSFYEYTELIFFFPYVALQLAYIFLPGWTDKLHSFLGMLMLMIQSTVQYVRAVFGYVYTERC